MPFTEIALLILILLAAGAITGLLAGVFGVGGGGVLVPILYEVFRAVGVQQDVLMHVCVATSLAVIVPTSIRSYLTHKAVGAVDDAVLRLMAPAMFGGVIAGLFVAGVAKGWVLEAVFVFLCLLMFVKLAIAGNRWRLGDRLPGNTAMRIIAAIIGLNSTLVGIGGGAQVTAIMTLYGRAIHQSVATASGLARSSPFLPRSAMSSPAGTCRTCRSGSLGYVNAIGILAIIPTSLWLAPIGARLAHGLSRRTLEIAFGCFLLLVGLRFLAGLAFG